MRTTPYMRLVTGLLTVAAAGLRAEPSSATDGPSESHAGLIQRAQASFGKGVFYKPQETAESDDEQTFAPLIVEEITGATEGSFGAVMAGDPPAIDPARPRVYMTTSTARLRGANLPQVTYIWRYSAQVGRGVRITVGPGGSPLLWEALSTDEPRRLLFVSESLEQAAAREFGPSLPGRRFSLERATEETPNVFVVRALSDGPVPMGPYVYIAAPPRRDIVTVLCRCMPSQVDEFAATRIYDIAPLESIEKLAAPPAAGEGRRAAMRWENTLSWAGLVAVDGESLDGLLRWPAAVE